MASVFVIDTSILSKLVHSNKEIRRVISDFISARPDGTFIVPEIADYELRRELIKQGFTESIEMLNALPSVATYEPINTGHMRRASEIWAECRKQNHAFAGDKELDGDCILIAQCARFGSDVTVLTTNTKHIGRYVVCEEIPGA